MAVSEINPNSVTVLEYVPVNLSFSVIFEEDEGDPNPSAPAVTQASISSSDGKDYSKYYTLTISGTNVSIIGRFDDVFDRTIKYINADKAHKEVQRWDDLPIDFETVYEYKGPSVNSIILTLNVNTTQGSISATIEVENNFNEANKKLKEYIQKGKY